MLCFAMMGFLSWFNDDPEVFRTNKPFLTSGRDEVSFHRKADITKPDFAPALYPTYLTL